MNRKVGYLYLTLTFMIWGSLYVVSKYALASVPPITVLLLRYLIAVFVLFFLAKKVGFKKIKKEQFKFFLAIGGLGYAVSIALQLIGTQLMDSSLASLINSMNPVAITVLAAIFLREKLTVRKIVSIAISILGIYVIVGHGSGALSIVGFTASIGSVLLWSGASILISKISGDYDPVLIAFYGMIVAIVFVFPASLIELHFEPCAFTLPAILSIIYMAVVCTALAHTLWNKSLLMLDASTCSMLYPIQPLTSAVMGVVVLHEQLTMNYIIGAVLISVGIVIAVFRVKADNIEKELSQPTN